MWIVPSAGGRPPARPEPLRRGEGPLARLMEACRKTGMTGEAFCLLDITCDRARLEVPETWTVVPALSRVSPAEAARLAMLARPDAEHYGILTDDHVPRTKGWDRALGLAAGRWNVAYCNDLVHAGRDPRTGTAKVTGAVCLGGDLVREMGAAIPDGMTLADARRAWMALGRSLGLLRYLPGVVVERRRGEKGPFEHPDECAEGRARLFRWLNDEHRPLARRLRFAISHAAGLRLGEAPASPRQAARANHAHRAV